LRISSGRIEVEKFYELLAQKLEEDVVGRDDVLADFSEWDSLTALSIVAMIDAEYGVEIRAEDLLSVETAGDLEDRVMERCPSNA
jgi:acyl carrier protein